MKRPSLIPCYLPPMSVTPRPHQMKAIEDIESAAREGHKKILVTGEGGSGKTLVFGMVARRAFLKGKKTTILVSANCLVTKDLRDRDQTCGALDKCGLRGHYGVFSGGFPELEDHKAPIQVVSLQTLRSRASVLHELLEDTDIIIVDECHTSTFFKEIENVYEKWNWKLILNFTASPHNRSQGVDERHGDLERNTAMVRMPTYKQLQSQGFLVPLCYHSLDLEVGEKEKLDLSSEKAIGFMTSKFVNLCKDPRFTMLFGKPKNKGYSQLEAAQASFARHGLRFEIVGDETSQKDLELILKDYKSGVLNLMSVHWGSTGLDIPRTKNVILLRQIKSRDKYVQTVTRGSRPSPDTGKTHCDIWDFAGTVKLNARAKGLHPKVEDLSESIDDSVLGLKQKNEGEAILKQCIKDRCEFKMAANLIVCPKCHTLQPRQSIRVIDPSTGQMLSSMSDLMALASRENSIAYFRQQRKLAYANGWNPFAAHMKCREIGIEVPVNDPEFWRGSIFEMPNDESMARKYRKHLESIAPRLNERAKSQWDDRKIQAEVDREFAVRETSLAWS